MLQGLKRLLNVLVLSSFSFLVLPQSAYSDSINVQEKAEILKLIMQLEQNSILREQRIAILEKRLEVYDGNYLNVTEELSYLKSLNEDLVMQIKDWKNSGTVMETTIADLEMISTNWELSYNQIETQLQELEKYYKAKIVKTVFASGGIGIVIGVVLTLVTIIVVK